MCLMDGIVPDTRIVITGKRKLNGDIGVSGAKNAALPELAAAILSSSPVRFQNVPMVEDVKVMTKALERIGARSELKSNAIEIALPKVVSDLVPREIVETSRASILILGPLLARNGYARVSMPGGCRIGDRKINYHLEGLKRMGAEIQIVDNQIIARAKTIKGIDFTFPSKTVTGTENLLMAATLAQGSTVLRNCAVEPEVGDLIALLKKMGADIQSGNEANSLLIRGKPSLSGASHRIIPDRIELGTYIIAGCMLNNDLTIENAVPEHIKSLIDILVEIGIRVEVNGDKIRVSCNGGISPIDVETMPYPGFPTDLQAQLTTLLTQADGVSRIKENIFNNRFQHVGELNKLGADIEVHENVAIIRGKTDLAGQHICATDLRASAALVLGGLIAEGTTEIGNSYQLFRGYENMPEKLIRVGAELKVIREGAAPRITSKTGGNHE